MKSFCHIFLFVLFVAQGCSCGNSNFLTTRAADKRLDQRVKDNTKGLSLELPAVRLGEEIVMHTGFVTSYNHDTLVPDWAAYALTDQELLGENKPSCSFCWNPTINGRQASREDYSNSGWDKGHMVPKADLKWSKEAYVESHYFTNICPQDHDFNAGDWRKLEEFVRRMAKKFGTVYVICGPIFSEHKYGYIGLNRVAVPDAFFKAVLSKKGDEFISIGFIMENSSSVPQRYRACACSVNEIESITQIDLFHNLNDSIEEIVESQCNIRDWE